MAKEAGAVLLSYAPIIGDAIGSAARAAFSGASKGMARRTAARKEIVSEGKAWGGGGTMWGAAGTLGIGPHSAEISRRAAQMKAAELSQQGQALAAKYAGGAGTSLHGLAMDLTDGTITKLSKATADSLKEEK